MPREIISLARVLSKSISKGKTQIFSLTSDGTVKLQWPTKWKAKAFKCKSQLPGPRCIASQHFSTKILWGF